MTITSALVVFQLSSAAAEDLPQPKPAAKESPRPAAVQFVAGNFISADLKLGTMILKHRTMDATYSLNSKDIPITGDISSKMRVMDLEAGTRVLLKISGSNDVVGIHCLGPQVRARVQAIDAKKRTVTMQGHDALPFADNAQIAVGGRFPKLEDVPTGGIAFLRLTIDRKQVLRLHVISPAESTGPLDETRTVDAELMDIDLGKGTFKVRLDNDPKKEAKEYPSNAWIRTSLLDGRSNGLADLMAGMKVKLWLHASKEEVIFVRAEPTLRGVLKEINPLTNTITLVAPKGEADKSYIVEKNAQFMIHGWESELQDFQPGWTVSIVLTRDNRVRALWTLVNLLDK
jgi:hypothetical protein